MVADDGAAVLLVQEDGVRGAVARPVQRAQHEAAQVERVVVVEHDVGGGAGAERVAGPGTVAQRPDRQLVHAVEVHLQLGEGIVVLEALLAPGEEAAQRTPGHDARAAAVDELLRQADVVVVLVGEEQQLDVFDTPAERCEALLERSQRRRIVRADVDEREHVGLDHNAVHVADAEGRRQGNRCQSGSHLTTLHGVLTAAARPLDFAPNEPRPGGLTWL